MHFDNINFAKIKKKRIFALSKKVSFCINLFINNHLC